MILFPASDEQRKADAYLTRGRPSLKKRFSEFQARALRYFRGHRENNFPLLSIGREAQAESLPRGL
jgi:hypothetical protein